MTTIDHQQAAKSAAAEKIIDAVTAFVRDHKPISGGQVAKEALTAAAPHLRAGMAEELLDDTPGSPLTRGYQRLMDPKPGDNPVRTWEAAVRVMLDTLLEGGGEDK